MFLQDRGLRGEKVKVSIKSSSDKEKHSSRYVQSTTDKKKYAEGRASCLLFFFSPPTQALLHRSNLSAVTSGSFDVLTL